MHPRRCVSHLWGRRDSACDWQAGRARARRRARIRTTSSGTASTFRTNERRTDPDRPPPRIYRRRYFLPVRSVPGQTAACTSLIYGCSDCACVHARARNACSLGSHALFGAQCPSAFGPPPHLLCATPPLLCALPAWPRASSLPYAQRSNEVRRRRLAYELPAARGRAGFARHLRRMESE